jgi:hypothetical protein
VTGTEASVAAPVQRSQQAVVIVFLEREMSEKMSSNNSGEEPIARRRPLSSRRRRDGLIRFARDITSQNGEDGILTRIFELLPPRAVEEGSGSAGNNQPYWCVDVGRGTVYISVIRIPCWWETRNNCGEAF